MSKLDAFRDILQTNALASDLTWLRIGGPLEYLARPRTEEELVELVKACRSEELETRVLGDGSALLVADEGARGVAIQLSEPEFCKVELEPPYVEVGGGAMLGRLVTTTASEGLSGLEGLIGTPGTVGAAALVNASTRDVSLGQWIESVRIATFEGEIVELSKGELVFGYRSSNLELGVVLSVRCKLDPDRPEEITKRLQKTWIVREQSRPELSEDTGYARLFKNPQGELAAELVEQVGLSGAKVGGASLCETLPNLMLTAPPCSSDDALRLIELIQQRTSERLGVELESELTVWR
ncbi:MAG: UDP-N-acetylmuramate dehydrogenase [Thermoguttaceae bacterium]|jgi:UDP-N-acetylenolpyruvoylglucosamine reductase